jgi:catechol 2,3-dioxygenase-like lactoylglutathione lyase family enzyme
MRIEVAIDVNDLELMITFYENLLGYQTHHTDTERYGPDQIYYSAIDPTGLGPWPRRVDSNSSSGRKHWTHNSTSSHKWTAAIDC